MSSPTTKLFKHTRLGTETLCAPLEIEDYVVQTITEISPTKWHLAHTSWFFETFILKKHLKNYKEFHPKYNYLFNSYYNTIGKRHVRHQRGDLTRPTVKDVYAYRKHVTENVIELLETQSRDSEDKMLYILQLAINHEQQHQELLLSDIKNVFSQNPLYPTYSSDYAHSPTTTSEPIKWLSFKSRVLNLGANMNVSYDKKFYFDVECPQHKTYVQDYQLANRLVTNGEFLEFIQDGGYENYYLWLSEGWDLVDQGILRIPLYWVKIDGEWQEFTLEGLRPLKLNEPVCHVSYFEADAYARWVNCHLPTEAEWENAIREGIPGASDALSKKSFDIHPRPFRSSVSFPDAGGEKAEKKDECDGSSTNLMLGELWEWTSSHYSPYPGYNPSKNAIGEYNGKFMSNQFVLRGSACITPQGHSRVTYRNFYLPKNRWQFAGIRLAKYI